MHDSLMEYTSQQIEVYGNRNESCNETYARYQKNTIVIIAGCNATISFATCLVAISLVICFRLYKIFTYRLAMYQVLAGMMFSFSAMFSFVSINYNRSQLASVIVCKMQAFVTTYFLWVKLLFSMNLMFHLLCLSVFMKNFKKLEMFYVLFSTLFPLVFTWIPFLHDNYDIAGAWCWIRDWKDDCASKHYLEGIIEQFALWYGPLVVFLVISIVMALVIFSVLLWRMCRMFSSESHPLLDSNLQQRQKKMLRDLIPLLAYPIIFCLITLVPVINRVYNAISHIPSYDLTIVHAFTNFLMGFFSGTVLIIHVFFIRFYNQDNRSNITINENPYSAPTVRRSSKTTTATAFIIPPESEIDELFNNK